MPEIKNTFIQGKMNKDLDERLVPNGQYRDAVNVEVSTSEGSDVGAVKNILGNKRIEEIVPEGFKCVGSFANEKTNKLYWFISSYKKDAIIEHDIVNDKINPVVVDLNAGNSKAVLKFSGNIITGINVINNLLFWTDNNSEPKKINIDDCKKGTPKYDASGVSLNVHTQLIFENGSFDAITLKYVAPSGIDKYVLDPPNNYTEFGKFFWFEKKQLEKLFYPSITVDGVTYPFVYGTNKYAQVAGGAYYVRHYRDGRFLGKKRINVLDYASGTSAYLQPDHPNQNNKTVSDWKVGDVIFGNDIRLDIEERHITVIKPKPLKAPTVTINHTQTLDSPSNIPNLFETTFPRFSYRYKYKDGEFSAFAPFTQPVFNPKYTKDTNNTNSTNVFYTKDNVYDVKDPHNKAMVNSIHSIELTDFVTAKTPEDAIEIEFLYKQENSNVIYSIDTIKQTDPEWHDWSNREGQLESGFGKSPPNTSGNVNQYVFWAEGGYIKGKYIVTTENIYAALPANQLLRPWDNVPRKALGQEMTGGRIVYGNYLQNYNLGNIKPEIKVGYNDRKNQLVTFENKGLPSIKSQRNYQLGIIYCDEHGRETPVFTSNKGAVNIPWQKGNGTKNASNSLQLNASVVANFPDWVDSFKIFVKETSSPYYNLVMDRAWVAKSTYEIDRGEHLWISFPSSDRNKVSEEDYIVLKKKIGAGEEQVTFENKFKVIDVQNEAPDAIKYELINLGIVKNQVVNGLSGFTYGNSNTFTTGLFPGVVGVNEQSARPDKQVDIIKVSVQHWNGWMSTGAETFGQVPLEGDSTSGGDADADVVFGDANLYISWRREGGVDGSGLSSKKYKVIGGKKGSEWYTLKLANKISKIDADVAHILGKSTALGNFEVAEVPDDFHPNLIFQVEKRELKDSEDFSGKFFVKISKNQVTDLIEEGASVNVLDNYILSAKTPTWYWQDEPGNRVWWDTTSHNYGLRNYGGYDAEHGSVNSIHHPNNNNNVGDTLSNGNYRRLSDDHHIWDGILEKFGRTFFVDSMHMVAGQSEASNYAKYCCVTWSGANSENDKDNPKDSAWSYPPLKTWLTDWKNSDGVVKNFDDSDVKAQFYDAINSGLIDTSPLSIEDEDFKLLLLDDDNLSSNSTFDGAKVTGWAGPSQSVDRTVNWLEIEPTHINGLEGMVTTTENHASGPRRWFSGITSGATDHGVGLDTKTYSDDGEIGRHFMHLSFFAPGKDLHNGKFSENGISIPSTQATLFDGNSIGSRLQGIWGGGVFTGGHSKHPGLLAQDRFGTGAFKFSGLPMEGNYDETGAWLPETPGPGVGFGYNLDYQELHERQWDPTFGGNGDEFYEKRDFIRNLHAGSQFKFSGDPDENVYTIKKVTVKKLYNHTSWRTPFNFVPTEPSENNEYYYPTETSVDTLYKSVEQTALAWLDTLGDNGLNGNVATDTIYSNFTEKIVNFGKASNRRLCYIIELDKNPVFSSFNILHKFNNYTNATGGADGVGLDMSADLANSEFNNIEFLEKVQSTSLAGLNKFSAIWETDPKKQQVDLDIYYEASDNIHVKLNASTNELIAPIGCKVEMLGVSKIAKTLLDPYAAIPDNTNSYQGNSAPAQISHLFSWDGTTAVLFPGLPVGDDIIEIEYSGVPFKFTREDGSYVILIADEQQLLGQSVSSRDSKTSFVFRRDIGDNIKLGLAWYNCFSFGNGLESNRIRDDFNETYIGNGVKASTTTQQPYKEEHRAHGLIYSGLYNSNSGVNDLNQFIMAEKITKDLNPTYGSIQKLFSRDSDLVTFCEDKVVKVLANKDAVFNADGNPQLTANTNVLGQTIPFVGEYGISTNPESFASESYRAYFTDKQRGAVLRLSKDGLTPISKAGMQDYFRDNLLNYDSLIGSYDSYKEDYNITLSHKFGENFIYNAYFDEGVEIEAVEGSLRNLVLNPLVTSTNFEYAYNIEANKSPGTLTGAFEWGPPDMSFGSEVQITYHPPILVGDIQGAAPAQSGVGAYDESFSFSGSFQAQVDTVYTTTITDSNNILIDTFSTSVAYGTTIGTGSAGLVYGGGTDYGSGGTFDIGVDNSATSATYESAAVDATSDDIEFANATYAGIDFLSDSGWWYNPSFTDVTEDLFGSNPTQYADDNVYSVIHREPSTGIDGNYGSFYTDYDPDIEKTIEYPIPDHGYSELNLISRTITRNSSTKAIVFDRPEPSTSYVEFRNIGSGTPGVNGAFFNYNNGPGTPGNVDHSSFFNGDELHVRFELTCYATLDGSSSSNYRHGFNLINPRITLIDGATGNPVQADIFWQAPLSPFQSNQSTQDDYAFQQTVSSGMESDGSWNTNTINDYSPYFNNTEYRAHAGVDGGTSPIASASAVYTFPTTQTIPELYNVPSSGAGTVTVVCIASFKFIDPDQQDPDGIWNGGSTPNPDGITEVKVIEDLIIRIDQAKAATSSGYQFPDNTGAYFPLRHQLWEINNIEIKKGFGVIAPHQAFDAGLILSDIPEVTISAYTTILAGDEGSAEQLMSTEYIPGYLGYDIPAISAIPAVAIPGWVEVLHADNGEFTLHGNNAATYQEAQGGAEYGPTYNLNSGVEQVPYSEVFYVENTTGYTVTNNYGTYLSPDPAHPNYNVNQALFNTAVNVDGVYVAPYPAPGLPEIVPIDENFIHVEGTQGNTGYSGSIQCDIPDSPWEGGETNWYLVDVEYDESYNSANGDVFGSGGSKGQIQTHSVGDPNGIGGAAAHPEGVGYYQGASSGTIAHELVDRTEYGTQRPVLRAIFKLHPNCGRLFSPESKETFILRLQGFTPGNTARLTKLIVKRLDAQATDVAPSNWDQSTDILTHSFSKKEVYYKDNSLCFDIETVDNTNANTYWEQIFPADYIKATPGGWALRFTVNNNPDHPEGDYAGNLRAIVNNDEGSDGNLSGMHFKQIQEPGSYELRFNFNDNLIVSGNENWGAYRNGEVYPAEIILSSTQSTWSMDGKGNRIWFGPTNGVEDHTFRMGISNISLIDQTLIFQGGTSGSWNWDGFNTSLQSYVSWDDQENEDGTANNRIQFGEIDYLQDLVTLEGTYGDGGEAEFVTINSCPFVDPLSADASTLKTPISANQWVDRTINRYETYNIEFEHGITEGQLDIYYFNSEGYGFRIPNINKDTPSTAKFTVAIGLNQDDTNNIYSEKRSSQHPAGATYKPELQETFVVGPSAYGGDNFDNITLSNEVLGWIDNISMTRVYTIELADDGETPMFEEKTVTFSEGVNGWTSFKSFVPESGVSLSKKYFTFDKGKLYKHYVPLKYQWSGTNSGFIKSTLNDAENYNIFYDQYEKYDSTQEIKATEKAKSKIKFVLNNEPSVVKMFNTLNYEGTQSHVALPEHSQFITINNAEAWQKGRDIQGWKCEEIRSDLDAGTVIEFIKKEGKWFNYIKGKATQDIDTSRFSVQGIGELI